ncbi:unnamed protein product, partial [Didymodactylos carnosus]
MEIPIQSKNNKTNETTIMNNDDDIQFKTKSDLDESDEKLVKKLEKLTMNDDKKSKLVKKLQHRDQGKQSVIKESAELAKHVAKQNMKCFNVPGDGQCFYHSVEHQLDRVLGAAEFQNLTTQPIIEHGINEILNNIDHYIGCQTDIDDPNEFINSLENEWADNCMIQAIADALNLEIRIIRSDGNTNTIQ